MASATGTPVLASLASTSSSAPRLSGALPGNTSTAVINWESVSTTMAALCPSNRLLLLLLWPWRISGSCTDIMRSRLTPSLRFTPSSVRSTSPVRGRGQALEQQLPQQFRRRHYPLALSAVLRQFPPAPAATTPKAGPRLSQSWPAAPSAPACPTSRWRPRLSRWNPGISHIPGPGPIP